MRSPLNRKTAPIAVRFFDTCFKQGVIDAYNLGNDIDAKDFLDKKKSDWTFGVLGEPDDYDWQMFRFALYRWGRFYHYTKFSEEFIYRIVKKNYLWYFLPYCMRFYLMGIEEWLEYPNPVGIEIFKSTSKIHWKPMPGHLSKMTTSDIISYMQEFAYEYRRIPEEKKYFSAVSFDGYCQAVHDLTRKYVTGRKIRIEETEEDI